MYVFRTKDRKTQIFEDYIERDLNTVQTDAGEINSAVFNWQEKEGGLVLGTASQ